MNERSLQINVNSMDDARAVIAHLPRIKSAYDAANCDSVEFFISEPVMKAVEATLRGAIRWCKTFVRAVPLGEGNTWFELPHYAGASACGCAERTTIAVSAEPPAPTAPSTAAVTTASGEQVATPRGVAAVSVAPAAVKPTVEPQPPERPAASRPRARKGA